MTCETSDQGAQLGDLSLEEVEIMVSAEDRVHAIKECHERLMSTYIHRKICCDECICYLRIQGPPRTRIVDGEIVRDDDIRLGQPSQRQSVQPSSVPNPQPLQRPQRPQRGASGLHEQIHLKQLHFVQMDGLHVNGRHRSLFNQNMKTACFNNVVLRQAQEPLTSEHSLSLCSENHQSSPCLACLG